MNNSELDSYNKNEFGLKVFNSNDSLGRFLDYDEDLWYCKELDPFLVDERIKILPSKALRRNCYKTQVFDQPYNKHIRIRMTHTLEVMSLSSLVSEKLKLNTYLCNAISAGHDFNHFPFGHTTEDLITNIVRTESNNPSLTIDHVLMGFIVAHMIERKCDGLNLSYETMEGILYHSTGGGAFSIESSLPNEYSILRYMDKVAYLFGDINDAERLGVLNRKDPIFKPIYDNLAVIEKEGQGLDKIFCKNQRAHSYICIKSLIEESKRKGFVSFSEGPVFEAFDNIRRLMYELVYDKIDWSLQNMMTNKIYDVLKKCSLNDYKMYCNSNIKSFIKERKNKNIFVSEEYHLPHPAILIGLLTDYDVNTIIDKFKLRRKLTLKDVLYETPLHEMVPYLMLKDIPIISLAASWDKYRKNNPRQFLKNALKI